MRFGVAFLLAMLVPASGFAEDAADVQMARTLGIEGLRLAEAGDCTNAVDKLSRAEKLHHAPTTLARLGECRIALGHYVDGTEDLRAVVREQLAPSAPAPFVAAKARAQKALDAALSHIAKLRIDVTGPSSSADVSLKIDSQAVSSASLGALRPIDPGAHVVEASAPGFKPSSLNVQVDDGGSRAVTLTLEAEPKPLPTTRTTTHRVLWPTEVAAGVAAAGVVLTIVFGSVAVAKKSDLMNTCGGTRCPPTEQGAFNDVSAFASVANVGLIVAAVAVAAGVVLFFVTPKRVVVEHAFVQASPLGVTGWF